MCELLGMAFNQAVQANFSFRGFVHRGAQNRDGWGIAYYPGEEFVAQVMKEPLEADCSSLAEFIQKDKNICSPVFISHVRYATSEVCYANTHPFYRVLRGREYVFAHNGCLNDGYQESLPLGRWTPVGSTDSEYAFCHLMNIIENEVPAWDDEGFRCLEASMRDDVNSFGSFNCLLSDGEHLFCYRDKLGHKGLHYVKRVAPFSHVKLKDEDFEINLSEEKSPSQKGYIIATAPLTDEPWTELKPGRLLVLKKGERIFP